MVWVISDRFIWIGTYFLLSSLVTHGLVTAYRPAPDRPGWVYFYARQGGQVEELYASARLLLRLFLPAYLFSKSQYSAQPPSTRFLSEMEGKPCRPIMLIGY